MAVKKTFDFKLGATVALKLSKRTVSSMGQTEYTEKGEVVGRAHYTNSNPQYFVRYVTADGRQVENWIAEDAITEI